MVADRCYRVLNIEPGTSLDRVKDAYYRAAKKNHPDLFPEKDRHIQQLRMMRINEAYLTIVSNSAGGAGRRTAAAARRRNAADAGKRESDEFGSAGSAATGEISRFERDPKAVGTLKDPAYTYYKLGFRYYSEGRRTFFERYRKDKCHYMATDRELLRLAISCLKLYEKSYTYFAKVAEDYPHSIWYRDTLTKMYYLERYNAIYHRICTRIAAQLGPGKAGQSRETRVASSSNS